MKKVFQLMILVFGILIAGICSARPIECGGKEAQDLIKSMFYNKVEKTLTLVGKDVPSHMVGLRENAELRVSAMRSEGYNADANKYACAATITLLMRETKRVKNLVEVLRLMQANPSNSRAAESLGITTELYVMGLAGNFYLTMLPSTEGVEIGKDYLSSNIKYSLTEVNNQQGQKVPYINATGLSGFIQSSTAMATGGSFNYKSK
jgi:hypothetical protein